MCQQQQGGMFAAFRKVINVISHPITAGDAVQSSLLVISFLPRNRIIIFNLLQVRGTERPLIQSLCFGASHYTSLRTSPSATESFTKVKKHSSCCRWRICFVKPVFLRSDQVSVLSEDLRLQLSPADVMLSSGCHRCGIVVGCRAELRV